MTMRVHGVTGTGENRVGSGAQEPTPVGGSDPAVPMATQAVREYLARPLPCRLVALLCFYDEDPDWLAETVTSLALAGVDHLVAADGAYALYPGGKPSSGSGTHNAIDGAAWRSGIEYTLHVPAAVYAGNELEKRSLMFELGEHHAPDWYLVIDADERIIRCPADLKDRLAATDKDYADVMSLEHEAPVIHASAEDADWPQIHHSRHVKPRRCLVRAVPGTRVVGKHHHYITPDGRDLWGDEMGDPLRVRDMMIDHRNSHRAEARARAREDYYRARREQNAEPGIEGKVDRPYRVASDEKIAATNRKLRNAIRNYKATH